MKHALVKFTVDLYAPGVILSVTLAKWLQNVNSFHSRRTLWPNLPLRQLLDIDHNGSQVLQDFAHIRVTTIMDEYAGPVDGPLDQLLTMKSLEEVFDLARVFHTALDFASPYVIGITKASWVDLFEIRGEEVFYRRPLSVQQIAELANRAPTE